MIRCNQPQAHPDRCGCQPDAFQIARHSKRLVEQQRKRIASLDAECTKLRGELALAMKVPSVAAMHTFLETEVAKQNMQLGAECERLRQALQITRDTIDRQLEIIASRATGNYLDKLPVVRSLKAHRARCDAALAVITEVGDDQRAPYSVR